jgi:hypothetical protein
MTDLNIYPVKNIDTTPNKLKVPIHPNLPDLEKHFVLGIIGKRHTGKSVLATNLLLNPNMLNRENYQTCFAVSPTIMQDKTAEHIRKAFPSTIFPQYNDSLIRDIIKYQKSYTDEERPRVILLLDDMVGTKTPYLNALTTKSRHFCVSIIQISQNTKHLHKIARNNLTNVILFNTHNKKEFEDMYEAWGSLFGSPKYFKKLLDYATRQPYHFLHLDLQHHPPKAFECFTTDITNKFPREKDDLLNQFDNDNKKNMSCCGEEEDTTTI